MVWYASAARQKKEKPGGCFEAEEDNNRAGWIASNAFVFRQRRPCVELHTLAAPSKRTPLIRWKCVSRFMTCSRGPETTHVREPPHPPRSLVLENFDYVDVRWMHPSVSHMTRDT